MPARPASFCHIDIGDIGVTFVPDGHICSTPGGSYPGSPSALWDTNRQFLDDDGLLVMSLGTLLVRTAGTVALIDLGWGPGTLEMGGGPGPATGRISGGSMLPNLASVGVEPEDVDVVLFSHLHRDHTGWIVEPATPGKEQDRAGGPTFPSAHHYVSEAEWTYWTSEAPRGVGPSPTAEQLAVLEKRLSFVRDGERPVPGIDVVATPGHTPGHLSFVISSGEDRALVLGDSVHCPIELQEPELTFVVDVDPALAQRTRVHIERELTRPGTMAAGPHFADLVFGRLVKGQGRSIWSFPESQMTGV
jgi:glyoxylase-like metal-dependent hydrolase (beta-lactamase superfamily II)